MTKWKNNAFYGFAEKNNAPRTVKDVKIISGGKILENNKTVGECRSPLYDVPGGVTTMHVVVSQPPQEKGQPRLQRLLNLIFILLLHSIMGIREWLSVKCLMFGYYEFV